MPPLHEWLPEAPEQPSNVCAEHPGTPVVLDFGSVNTRIGVASMAKPSHRFLSRSAKFRDRKSGEQHIVVGNDVLLEPAARAQMRSPFDGPLLTNWEAAEQVLDYSLDLVGYPNNLAPLVVSEPLLAPHLPHRTLQELLFEGYEAPSVAFGADVLASAAYHASTTPDLLLVMIGADSTHILPVIDMKPRIEHARRINWGVRRASEYLHELLVLKYPMFPTPVNRGEVEKMMLDHCFAAKDYKETVSKLMDTEFLANFEVRVQAPVPTVSEATVENEKRKQEQIERRKESGRRLQEQTAVARAERQQRQQEELDRLVEFQEQLSSMEAEDALQAAQHAGFNDVHDVSRTTKQLGNTLRRARGETIEDPEPVTPLLDTPDAELSPEDLKEKRRQRLLRASYEARQRQRAAKEAQKQKEEEAKQRDADWRARDLAGWSAEKRAELTELLDIIREREKLKKDTRLRFRQTLNGVGAGAGAENGSRGSQSSGNASLETNEGLSDEESEPEERDYDAEAAALQMLLLEHDPDFDPAQLEPQLDWRDSTVHKFLWGAHSYDPENVEQNHQLNLNIERIRVVEPIFQPQIAGVDQAGLTETVTEILKRFPKLANKIQLSGGGARINGIRERLETDLRRELPADVAVRVSSGKSPELDAWRGMAKWSSNKNAFVSRKDYEENGADYIREHQWGNPYH